MPNQKHDSILIIGNGFDLNLELETSYFDFISDDTFNRLLSEKNQLCMYLKDQQELKNWIDIENELKNYSNCIYKDSNRRVFRHEYQQLCNSLCQYLNSLDMSSINEGSKAYDIITNELGKFKDLLILSYNYTLSIDYILEKNNLSHKVIKVHGNAKDNKIVFGVEDRARINANDVFLKKSTCIWNEIQNVNKMLSNADNIMFLGHSLGETDHHNFDDFFMDACSPYSARKNISISYYTENGKDDVFKQLYTLTMNNFQGLRNSQNLRPFDLAE